MTSPVILSRWYCFDRLMQHCKTQTHIAILIINNIWEAILPYISEIRTCTSPFTFVECRQQCILVCATIKDQNQMTTFINHNPSMTTLQIDPYKPRDARITQESPNSDEPKRKTKIPGQSTRAQKNTGASMRDRTSQQRAQAQASPGEPRRVQESPKSPGDPR